MSHTVRYLLVTLLVFICSCGKRFVTGESQAHLANDITIDSATGIPYASTFQHPIAGFDASDYGFGFGSENRWFCMRWSEGGQCMSYGAHLGRDTIVARTSEGTEVVAPADGIVRVSTDLTFGGYGSDSSANPSYNGCVIVLEHLLAGGQPVTTLLGHLRCEGTAYNASARRGNPAVGTVVKRGQYVAHVGHYWHGADQSTDWHHLHWAMRKGRFTISRYAKAEVLPWVQGYASASEFITDRATSMATHSVWLDPFVVVAANGDPVAQASANVRHHPPGTLLRDPDGAHWLVTTETDIASLTPAVIQSDRYDFDGAVFASMEEIACYRQSAPYRSMGQTILYVRPGTNTVAVAYDARRERYDFIRWEALLSWGFTDGDILRPTNASPFETYASRGFRLLRPGTLVKADEESEVAFVTMDQKRLPIVSGEVFEQAGFKWERIISLPKSVLDSVAGSREPVRMLTLEELHRCAVSPACPGGATSCGGGALPGCTPGERVSCPCTDGSPGEQICVEDGQMFLPCECPELPPSSDPPDDGVDGSGGAQGDDPPNDSGTLHLAYHSPVIGQLSIQGWWEVDRVTRAWDVIPCRDEDPDDDRLECDIPVPSGASIFEFQIYLPGPAYWGDQSCDTGGCGEPLGSLILTKHGLNVPVAFVPNPEGAPYYNGQIAPVP